MNTPKTFAEIYCEENQLESEGFETAFFTQVLPPVGRAIAKVASQVNPNSFANEKALVRSLGHPKDPASFEGQLTGLRHYNDMECPLWKTLLGLRMSLARARAEAKVLEDNPEPPRRPAPVKATHLPCSNFI